MKFANGDRKISRRVTYINENRRNLIKIFKYKLMSR